MPARIGFDATPLLGQRSGVGYYTARLLGALIACRPDWEFLLYSNRPLGELEPSLARAIHMTGQMPFSRWLWMQLYLPRAVSSSRPDVCHYTNYLAPFARRSPYVLSIHDASLYLFGRYHPWHRLATIRFLLPLLARRADAVITMSHSSRDDLARVLRLAPEKFSVIYEAAGEEFAPVADRRLLDEVRRRYELPGDYLLYVGTVEPRKNLRRVIRAYAAVRRDGHTLPLLLAGPWGWSMDGFARDIAGLGLEGSVRFLGYVPPADLPSLYSLATLFVFPSLYEGFGLPPLEAMACGAPVLTSRGSSLGEICGDAAWLVDPADQAAIEDGLRQLLADADLRAELAARGRARAACFSWRRAAEETAEVYGQVLSGV
ncbi:MAG: glycosyltransferase family 4 protein [Candidatus Promineifilaceae bacterium]